MDMYVGDMCYMYAGSTCMYAIPISDIYYPIDIHYPSLWGSEARLWRLVYMQETYICHVLSYRYTYVTCVSV